MLKVIPIQEKAAQEKACALCGAPYFEEMPAYAAYVNDSPSGTDESADRFVGVCQFRLCPEGGRIATLDAVPGNEEFQPMFVMGRAALSFMEMCGAETAYYDGPVTGENRVLIGAVGFKADADGIYTVDLRGFFDHPCSHGHATGANG